MKLKTREPVLIALLLSSCGGGGGSNSVNTTGDEIAAGSQTPDTTTDVPDAGEGPAVSGPGVSSTTGLSCRSPSDPVDQAHDVALFDALDYEAFSDLLESDQDFFDSSEAVAVSIAFSSLSVTKIESFVILAAAFYCDYEQYADNQCQSTLVTVTSADLSAGALSYTYSQSDDSITTDVMISDSQYSGGSYRRTDSDGKVTDITWSRDSDGTERFNMVASNGSTSEFMEFSDCSGNASRVYASSGGQPEITTKASWTSPTSGGFTASFEACNFAEDSPGCTSFTR
ncbi:MAG: hypothetical protein V3U76_04370 [Granulosicoccus sp.]